MSPFRKPTFMFLMVLFLLILAAAASGSPAGASARHFTWDAAFTYQHIGIGGLSTPVQIQLYAEDESNPLIIDPLAGGTLPRGASRSFLIGGLAPAGFQGSAVLIAKEPLALNGVRFRFLPPGFPVKMISSGFADAAGANTMIIPTVLLNAYDRTTVIAVQNLEATDVDVTLEFFTAASGESAGNPITHTLEAHSAKYIEMDKTADTGLTATTFDGSAIIDAEGTARIVASASEYFLNRGIAADFEGVPLDDAANTVYAATALCGAYDMDTYYAVTNVGNVSTAVHVEYYDKNGGSSVGSETTDSLSPGQKISIYACDGGDFEEVNLDGSAVITTTNQSGEIVVLGKAQQRKLRDEEDPLVTRDFYSIFRGEAAGSSFLAFPYVRYANDEDYTSVVNPGYQRSYFAIRNLESSNINVNVYYYGKDGNLCGSHTVTIATNGKKGSSALLAGAVADANGNVGLCSGLKPGSFGYYQDGTFGGSVLVKASSSNPNAKFIAISRSSHFPGSELLFGEDVNGIPVP